MSTKCIIGSEGRHNRGEQATYHSPAQQLERLEPSCQCQENIFIEVCNCKMLAFGHAECLLDEYFETSDATGETGLSPQLSLYVCPDR